MPRPKSRNRADIIDRALHQFWAHGFEATSMNDLVKATRVSRHGLYGDFSGKKSLFLACLEAYQGQVVTPAFARVEAPGASLADVEAYFETQIARAESIGLPGPGCLIANSMTENGPHDEDIARYVQLHNSRLEKGFSNALSGSAAINNKKLSVQEQKSLAVALVVFAQGLWSFSRTTRDATLLREAVCSFLQMISAQLQES